MHDQRRAAKRITNVSYRNIKTARVRKWHVCMHTAVCVCYMPLELGVPLGTCQVIPLAFLFLRQSASHKIVNRR